MLIQLTIQSFAIIDRLKLDFAGGMTVITGTTGAGKSVLLDALAFVLGGRSQAQLVTNSRQTTEVCGLFDLRNNPLASDWLKQQGYQQTKPQCQLKRSLSKQGRSQCWLNDRPVKLNQIKDLAPLLVNMHSQHQQQALLHKDQQRQVLDDFAGHAELVKQVAESYRNWQQQAKELGQLQSQVEQQQDRRSLLEFQIAELNESAPTADELQQLGKQHQQLGQAGSIISTCQQCLGYLDNSEGANLSQLVHLSQQALTENRQIDAEVQEEVSALLEQASIHVQEASYRLNQYLAQLECDPQQLQQVEHRLSQIHDLARKYRVEPHELPPLVEQLTAELTALNQLNERLAGLQQQIEQTTLDYQQQARQLSQQRQQAAGGLEQALSQQLPALELAKAKLQVQLQQQTQPGLYGQEQVVFLLSSNPGQSPKPLADIASGGELSRISLLIQVIHSQKAQLATLVFDEVDVGIGGQTADKVGQLLHQLGERGQVLCITHLPQVAAQAQQHLKVSKIQQDDRTHSEITQLNLSQRQQEIARMLAGATISQPAQDHAKDLLAQHGVRQ
jgi:DNA repair protein RecN (Recombination protein N)